MRMIALFAAVCLLSLGGPAAPAQTTPTKPAEPEWPNEIGGRPFTEWLKDLSHEDPSIRERAIRIIPGFGPIARKAVPHLIARTRDPDASPRVRAVQALQIIEIADEDIPKVIKALGDRLESDTQSWIRYCAVLSLGRFDPEDGKPALPHLVRGVEDHSSFEVRRACLAVLVPYAFDEKKGPDPGAIRALMRVVDKPARDEALQVRQEAAVGLAMLGKPSDPMLAAALEKKFTLLASPNNKTVDPSVAIWANVGLIALGKTGKDADPHLDPLLKAIRSSDLTLRSHGLRAIAYLGDRAKAAVPDLLDLLTSKEQDVVVATCYALARMGRVHERQISALTGLSTKKDAPEPVKQAAKAALDMINGKKDEPKR